MFNLVKADIYRLFKTRSYYIIGLILSALVLMVMYALRTVIDSGMQIGDVALDYNNPQLLDLLYNVFMNNFIPMVIGIGVGIYVCLDFSSGYIKNIASSVKRKATIALSKFITVTIGTTIYFILMILLTYVFGSLMIGNVEIGSVGNLFAYIGMSLFLNLVIVAFVILVAMFFRNSAATITTLVVVILAAQLGYAAIHQLLDIDLTGFSPIMNIVRLTPHDSSDWMSVFLSGLGFMAVYLVGASIAIEKKDIT